VHGGDDWHGAPAHSRVEGVGSLEEGELVGRGLASGVRGEVATCAERPPGAVEHDATDRWVGPRLAERGEDLVARSSRVPREGVEHLRAVEPDLGDAVVLLEMEVIELHGSHPLALPLDGGWPSPRS
jgi:hypothetical protein